MTDEFDKNIAIISGAGVAQDSHKSISNIDKKKLADAYFKLFYNLTYTNWLRGGNLGRAWYTALAQTKQFIMARDERNSASLYLKQIFSAHSVRWGRVMMTNQHREDVINADDTKKQQWRERAAKNTTFALDTLKNIVAQYNTHQTKNQSTTNPNGWQDGSRAWRNCGKSSLQSEYLWFSANRNTLRPICANFPFFASN